MRLLLVILLLTGSASFAQVPTISTVRLGELRPGMPADSVQLYLPKKLNFPPRKKDEYLSDTFTVMYKGLQLKLVFEERYHYQESKGDNEDDMLYMLVSIYSEDKALKTRSGIGFGDNKYDVLKKIDGSTIHMAPDWRHEGNKAYYVVVLNDYDNGTTLSFFFYNNSLYAIECSVAGDEC
jgi:hypothetical protein